MVTAVIFAGGVGRRMTSEEIPKQFIEVDGKPIIIRTLEVFDSHPEVDHIVIACLESWISVLEEQIRQYGIQKVRSIVPGGENGFGSIHNGLVEAAKEAAPEDIVLICDGVRPMISPQLVSNCIRDTRQYTSAVPVTPSIDSVLVSQDGIHCGQNYSRREIFITQAPQGYTFERIMKAHEEAIARHMADVISSADLLIELGQTVHIFMGERQNIKVTTPEDLYTLRSHYYYQHYRRFAQEEFQYER